MPLFIGLMSGTSLDGVDGVLADIADPAPGGGPLGLQVRAHAHAPMPAALASELLALNSPAGVDELQRGALAGNALARLQAEVVHALLQRAGCPPANVRAIGSHGQTVRHRPAELDGTGFTLQLNQPALLAELTGIDVVADFRSRDVAAGGQGAPLVPAFHAAMFGGSGQARALLNIGGIANLSLLTGRPGDSPLGFDTGPGNLLMDGWCQRHKGAAYDADGAWGAVGQVLSGLLQALLADAYFAAPAPKSTGRDRFHAAWLDAALVATGTAGAEARDVQATLCALTAHSISEALQRMAPATRELLVCGGGAFNGALMARLAALNPGCRVGRTDDAGLPAMQVEAAAFAWLARECLARRPANDPGVTGARGPRILGAVWPA